MTYKYNINNPCKQLNILIAKNPQLKHSINRNKNHPLMRDYSHILFII